jgi:hypothetical protein
MKDLEEQSFWVKFCLKLARTCTETFQMLKQGNGEDCLSRTQCYEWYQPFKSGSLSTEYDLRTDRPSTSTDDDNFKGVQAVIFAYRSLAVCEVSEEEGFNK